MSSQPTDLGRETADGISEATKFALPLVLEAVLVVAVFTLAVGLRFYGLGEPSLHPDEALHVAAAASLNAGQGPAVPSGELYPRALPFTRVVAWMASAIGSGELAVRLPAAVAGTGLVVLAWGIARTWFGGFVAWLVLAALAVAPMAVEASRFGRMYSAFGFFYLLALFAYERSVDGGARRFPARWLWLVIGLVAFFAALQLHVIGLAVGSAFPVYWIGMAAAERLAVGKPGAEAWWIVRRDAILLIGVGLVLGLAWFTGLLDFEAIRQRALFAPALSGSRDFPLYYVEAWRRIHPWIWWIVLPSTALLLWGQGRRGFFLLCQWALPLALFSFVLPWKAERYVWHLFPLFVLAFAGSVATGLQLVWSAVGVDAGHSAVNSSAAGGLVGEDAVDENADADGGRQGFPRVVLAIAFLGLVVSFSASPLEQSISLLNASDKPQWREALAYVAGRMEPDDPLVVSLPLVAEHYLGHPATHVANNIRINAETRAVMRRDSSGAWLERYSGLPLIYNVRGFDELRRGSERGWVVVDLRRFGSPGAIPTELRKRWRTSLRRHDNGDHPLVLVLSWGVPPDPAP